MMTIFKDKQLDNKESYYIILIDKQVLSPELSSVNTVSPAYCLL